MSHYEKTASNKAHFNLLAPSRAQVWPAVKARVLNTARFQIGEKKEQKFIDIQPEESEFQIICWRSSAGLKWQNAMNPISTSSIPI